MKKQRNHKNALIVKTGTVEDFFKNTKKVMRALDKKESIQPSRTLIFAEPLEMLRFLSEKKIELINIIRDNPDSITNIAKLIKRNRTSVCRDINEMERFGFVRTHEEINTGHGRHKIVKLVSPQFKLEAYI